METRARRKALSRTPRNATAGSARLLAAGLLALLVAAGGAEGLVPVWSLAERSDYTAVALARDGPLLAAGDREV